MLQIWPCPLPDPTPTLLGFLLFSFMGNLLYPYGFVPEALFSLLPVAGSQ